MKRAFDPLDVPDVPDVPNEVNAWYGRPWDEPPPAPPAPPDERHKSAHLAVHLRAKEAAHLQRVGVVLGRFRPPHLGHLHLVEQAFMQCGWLHIVSRVSGGDRAFVYAFSKYGDTHLHFPNDADNPMAWVDIVDKLVPRPTHLFSSDPEADAFAHALGIEHVLVDPARREFPISSTKIRLDLGANFHWIVPDVRMMFVFRVGVIGAEGAGKSTLCRELATMFQAPIVEDALREESRQVHGAVPSAAAFQRAMETCQPRTEAAARDATTGIVLCDDNMIATRAWAERLGVQLTPHWQYWSADGEHRHVWLLCHNDFPFPYEGQERDEPDKRRAFFETLTKAVERKDHVVHIKGEGQARVELAAEAIRRLFAEHAARVVRQLE